MRVTLKLYQIIHIHLHIKCCRPGILWAYTHGCTHHPRVSAAHGYMPPLIIFSFAKSGVGAIHEFIHACRTSSFFMRQQPVVVSFVFISIDDQSRLPFMSCHACLSRLFFHLLLLSVPLYLVHSNPVGTSAVVLLFVRHLAPQIKDGGGLALLLLWPVCSLFWFLAATEMSPIVFATAT